MCPLGMFGDSSNLGCACWNCESYLMGNRIPPVSLYVAHTELQFPVIPPEYLLI